VNDHLLFEDELLEAVREARPGLPVDAVSPSDPAAHAVLERVLASRRGGRGRSPARSARRRVIGGAPLAAAIGVTVLVVVVAVLSLRAHTPAPRAGRGGHGARGEIVARDGRALAGPIARGLETTYTGDLGGGDVLKTTINWNLQQAGDRALQHAISLSPSATGGAFVALDPGSGQVYAIGTLPSDGSLDRVTQFAGPVGSAIAPVTALAALESGAWSVGERFDDTGQYCFQGQCRHNAGAAVDGVLDLESALKVSSNDFFYNLGVLTNSPAAHGGALQHWARMLGIGSPTGVDLPDEVPGTLPTPAWRAQRNRLEAECDAATGPFAGGSKHAPGGCGIADGTNRPWSAGDNENLAGGQGDVQLTPLQLAVAYAALANGGTIVRPHLGASLDHPDGTLLHTISPPPVRHLNIDPVYLDAIRAGLRASSAQPGGTSADVFRSFPEQVYGKTATAQYDNQQDYAWYAGFVPASATSKPIVVVVTVEQGGFGDVSAAPVARQILSQWFLGRPGPWVVGASQTL
jgi:penicillin-binding protein 2